MTRVSKDIINTEQVEQSQIVDVQRKIMIYIILSNLKSVTISRKMSRVVTTYPLRQHQGNGRGVVVYDAQRMKRRIMVTLKNISHEHNLQTERI